VNPPVSPRLLPPVPRLLLVQIPQLLLERQGGGGSDGPGGRRPLYAGRRGSDDEGEKSLFGKIWEEIKFQFNRAFGRGFDWEKRKGRGGGGKGGGGKGGKGKKGDGKPKKKKGIYKVDKSNDNDEEPADPKDPNDERNYLSRRLGWLFDKSGKRRQFWVFSLTFAIGFAVYEALIAPWSYYMWFYDMKPENLPQGAMLDEMKFQERQETYVDHFYKSLGFEKGTAPRVPSEDIRKGMRRELMFDQREDSLIRDQLKYRKMLREKRAYKKLMSNCVEDRATRRRPLSKWVNWKSSSRKCAFWDMNLLHPYWSKVNPDATEIEVRFPGGGVYRETGKKYFKEPFSKRQPSRFKEWISGVGEGFKKSISDFRVLVALVASGEAMQNLKENWKIHQEWIQEPDKPYGYAEMKRRHPERFDKDGDWIPLPESKDDPNNYANEEFERLLAAINQEVPHGSRPPGSRPYLNDKFNPVVDPAVY